MKSKPKSSIELGPHFGELFLELFDGLRRTLLRGALSLAAFDALDDLDELARGPVRRDRDDAHRADAHEGHQDRVVTAVHVDVVAEY